MTDAGTGAETRPKIPVRRSNEQQQEQQGYTKYKNPFCEAEAEASMRCMNENEHIRDKCFDIFQQYRDCKKKFRDDQREKLRNQPLF